LAALLLKEQMSETPSQEEIIQSIQVIKNIRQRPGMYFGSVGSRGVEQFIYELVANVLDSYLADRSSFVNVELDGVKISVVDDGPGLPFDEPSDLEGVSLATKFLTNCHFTRSEDDRAPHVHMGALGLGLAPLNACSAELKVQSWKSGTLWQQSFIRGVAQGSAMAIAHGSDRGTRIEVIPDPEIFGQIKPRPGMIRRALFETTHLFGGLKIGFNQERFHAPTGLQALGYMLLDPMFLYDFLRLPPERCRTPFHITLRYENIFIEAAAFEDEGSLRRIFSWVNGVGTPEGGSHAEGFLEALQAVDWQPGLILIHVVMYDPKFAGPVRQKLDVPHVREAIRSALHEPLLQYRKECHTESV
jgi:DNA gyrase subunit B